MRRYPKRFWGQGSIPHRRLTQISPPPYTEPEGHFMRHLCSACHSSYTGSRSQVEFSVCVLVMVPLSGGSGFCGISDCKASWTFRLRVKDTPPCPGINVPTSMGVTSEPQVLTPLHHILKTPISLPQRFHYGCLCDHPV